MTVFARTTRAYVVLIALAGSGLGLLIASRPMASAAGSRDLLGAPGRVDATGGALAPAYPALLLATAAAALALAFAGRWLRPLVAAGLLAGGIAAEIAWRVGLAAAPATLERARSAGVGGAGLGDAQVAHTLSIGGDVAALAVAAAGAVALLVGARWPAVSRRYDAVPAGGQPGLSGDGLGGETLATGDAAATAGADGSAASARGVAPEPMGEPPPVRKSGADDDWEALSRGEDPTL